jgi:hypothetical protein
VNLQIIKCCEKEGLIIYSLLLDFNNLLPEQLAWHVGNVTVITAVAINTCLLGHGAV